MQTPPAGQWIKAFAVSRGTPGPKLTGSITARQSFALQTMREVFRPEAGRKLPSGNLRILRSLTTCRGQVAEMRKRLSGQIRARVKQGFPANPDGMDDEYKTVLAAQISEPERRTENVLAREETSATKAKLLRSTPLRACKHALSGNGNRPGHRSNAHRGNAGAWSDDVW